MRFLSVCSGIEAASVAWGPLGWKAAAFSEIEAFPSAVLAHHYPQTPNWGDMTRFQEWPDADVSLLVGGTPCQSFSVAGLRRGLDDPRGNLALVYLALADRYRPRWLVWENVPGVLSSNGGRDFGAFLGGLGQLGYGFAYRVLDAQYVRTRRFGGAVPQRRRRVFVVGYLGDWRRAAAVLFDRESLSGHPPPRREEGQRPAPTLAVRTRGGGGLGTDFDCDGGLVAFGGNNTSGPIDVATACTHTPGRYDFESETFVAHSLRGEGFDASEDGTGRGTPLVPIQFQTRGSNLDLGQGVAATIGSNADRASGGAPCIAFSSKDHGADAMANLSPTLRAGGHDASHANAGVPPAIAFPIAEVDAGWNSNGTGIGGADDPAPTLQAGKTHGVAQGWAVRRLMPVECERLQGFPDGYTDVPYRSRNWTPDGPRYKALGNSMACNVMAWIGERMAHVEAAR